MNRLFLIMCLSLLYVACSQAPVVEFPEPGDRVVLAELFTEDE